MIQERYNELLAEMHLGEAMLEYPRPDMSLARHFIEASERPGIEANYLVFGSKGLSGRRAALGSVAAYCVKHARVGVVVIKDSSRELRPREELMNKGAGL